MIYASNLGFAATLGLLCLGTIAEAGDAAPDFAREVRPLLSDRCFGCHGPGHQESGLRLDTHDGATEWAIEPGDSEASEVLARITSTDPDLQMPPADSDIRPLTDEEIELIRRWIDAGAEYEAHWAFAPLVKPAVDTGASDASPVDAFISRRLQAKGWELQPEADRNTLARRVSFDLLGLPPTPDQLAEFLADTEPGAYERFVDRLLASPRYGEHMARYWLDAVRYGDTHGKHYDNYREIWPYRDWVVRSFNDNKPYDDFLIEQLAGDLLPEPTTDQLVATGFNRCNMTTNEGGVIDKEVYTDNVRDRTDAYGTVVLGMTLGCAKCHDHKYDPVTQKEYYSLFAFFNSLDGKPRDANTKDHAPSMRVPLPDHEKKLSKLRDELSAAREGLVADDADLDGQQARWEQLLTGLADPSLRRAAIPGDLVTASDWLHAGPFNMQRYQVINGKSPPETEPFDRAKTWEVSGARTGWRRRGEWIDGEGHPLVQGNNTVSMLRRTITVDEPTELEIAVGSDDTLRILLNREVVHEHKETRPLTVGSDRVKLQLKAGVNELMLHVGNLSGAAGFSFAFIDSTVLSSELLEIAKTPSADRTPDQAAFARRLFRERSPTPAAKGLRERVAEAEAALAKAETATPTTLIFRERAEPRPAFVLNRGDYDNEGEPVDRLTPAFLPPMDEGLPRNRLGLARWSVSPENPLPARVAVNRFWQQFFGVGLVKTADDFGSQAEPPSHPDLLDWLAADYTESGWDTKRLIKQIVMSRAYRQTSTAPEELWLNDPQNRLLGRGPRHRLDAEQLRDQALAVSGLLVNRLGGPPVKPPQPGGLWKAVGYQGSNTVKFVADTGSDKVHRRSLYTFHKRTSPPPQMAIMDGPTRESCTIRRERTNTPLQALMLMNDPQYVEAARAFAQRVLSEAPEETASQARLMIELATSRTAEEIEVAELAAAVEEERKRYADDLESAGRLISIGANAPESDVDKAELAAWTMAANLVLNLDEVLSKN